MKEPTSEQLATLARAMGYTVTLDDSGGYGVARLIATSPRGGQMVFRPHKSSEQAWEVMAWMMKSSAFNIDDEDVWVPGGSLQHDGTAAGIRRAVVEAAIMVAKS